MRHIDTYIIFENRYKNRGIFGKVSDLISGREDMSSIIQGNSRVSKYSYGSYYKFDNDSKEFSEITVGQKNTYLALRLQFLKLKDEYPNSFALVGLNSYESSYRYTTIKLEILLNDLFEITNNQQLDILWIEVAKNGDNLKLNVSLREKDFQNGDGMPSDVRNNYVNLLASALKRKSSEYVKKYNILQRQRTSQKMNRRSIKLYRLRSPLYISDFDRNNGIITIEIDPRF